MQKLNATLRNSDEALLPIVATFWQINPQNMDSAEIIAALMTAMQDPAQTGRIWDALDDEQRGALQTLMGSGGKLSRAMFERLFGEIRKMGVGRIEREKPHENPASVAEALYYRGLIAEAFTQADTGAMPVIYIAPELAAALPTHKTGYSADALANESAALPGEFEGMLESVEVGESVYAATTALVDDLTTLLVYIQLHSPQIDGTTLAEADQAVLAPYLLLEGVERLAFMVGIGLTAGLIEVQAGSAYTRRAEVRRWLAGKRCEQVQWLSEAWHKSTDYADLWHVPGLHPEPTGWPYDPVVARGAMLHFMNEFVPKETWWSLDDFVTTMKEVDPDFQRPGGDYDSWYIRNDAGEYLDGFESWDSVEGALLEFYLLGPMHWLGLVDLAEDAARLTAYGRAFVGQLTWPTPPENEEKIIVQQDGTLLASRRVSRLDRFQLARFTTWDAASDPYIYTLDADGIQQATEQGITTEHIAAFVKRHLGDAQIPLAITRLLSAWESGPKTAVTLEHLLVLRTTAPETLDTLWDTPAFRRFLGARLGPMAVVARTDQWEALAAALGEEGIQVEVIGEP